MFKTELSTHMLMMFHHIGRKSQVSHAPGVSDEWPSENKTFLAINKLEINSFQNKYKSSAGGDWRSRYIDLDLEH